MSAEHPLVQQHRLHECAHGVVAWKLFGMRVDALYVRPDRAACEYRHRHPDPVVSARAGISIALAGDCATDVVRGRQQPRLARTTDELAARDAARRLAALTGQSPTALLERERSAVRLAVAAWWPQIAALAESLRVAGDELIGPDLDRAMGAAWAAAPGPARPSSSFTDVMAELAARRTALLLSQRRHSQRRRQMPLEGLLGEPD